MEEPGIPIPSFRLCVFLNAADGESSGHRKKKIIPGGDGGGSSDGIELR